MKEEIDLTAKNKVWELVYQSFGRNVIANQMGF
jgi:hypothetical protein